MKFFDIMPVLIVVAALLINLAIGIGNNLNFSILMIRSIVVIIIFGVFGHMVTETIRNAIECSKLGNPGRNEGEEDAKSVVMDDKESKSMLDIKVPPLDDEEFISMDNNNDNEFVEVNPVFMGKYRSEEQD